MTERPFLSIVIPAYNEEKIIGFTYDKIKRYLDSQNYSYEIIIVDDASIDRTGEMIEEIIKKNKNIFYIRNQTNKGKGYSVKTGVLQAKGKYLLFLDADLPTPIEEVKNFLPYLEEGFDIVIGSRKLPGANILKHQPFYREFMGKIYTWLCNRILLLNISDITCGFKCFERMAALNLFSKQQLNDWSFDAEILSLARRYKYRIKELPVCWKDSSQSHVVLFRDTLKSFLGLFRIWMIHSKAKDDYADIQI